MPRGVASVFSTLQNIDMFKQIEVLFNTKGIRLELLIQIKCKYGLQKVKC